MFAAIYSFTVKPDQEQAFESAWKELTEMIYEYEGSLGSRLHKQDDQQYIAYAQWPSREVWEQSGDKLPEASQDVRQRMKESCDTIETLYTLDMVDDLMREETHQQLV